MIVKIDQKVLHYPWAKSFTIVGDPGCDGLGAENLDVFIAALKAASGDLIFLIGDVVPVGAEAFYQRMAEVIPHATDKPILALKGNHDLVGYDQHFGYGNYAVEAGGFSVVVLDNSAGPFSEEGLEFLYQSARALPPNPIVVMFHRPPPNNITGNSMAEKEWRRFLDAVEGVRDRISLLIAGHVHSYFEDRVDGIPLVATGGGGSRIEHVDRVGSIQNHVVEFLRDPDGRLRHFRRDVTAGGNAGRDVGVRKILFQTYAEECAAHVGYLMRAEDAERQGFPNLARLYRAAADSELRHARNVHRSTTMVADYLSALRSAVDSERLETDQTYKQRLETSDASSDVLAKRIFSDTLAAERVHLGLFQAALDSISEGIDIPPAKYHTCASCGMTFVGAEPPRHCPVCGAPAEQIRETE